MTRHFFFLVVFSTLLVCSVTYGEYDISWWTLDSSGDVHTGGNYKLRSSIGQPGEVVSSGGNYVLEEGYLAIPEKVEEITKDMIVKHILSISPLSGDKLSAADRNGDSMIDVGDLITLIRE